MTAKILSLRLTEDQSRIVEPILAHQREGKTTAVLSLVSSSYEPEIGQSTVKLELAWLDRKLAQKIAKLIRTAEDIHG